MKDELARAKSGSGVPPLFLQSEEAGRLFHFKTVTGGFVPAAACRVSDSFNGAVAQMFDCNSGPSP
jgi:hypothetical protein